MKIKVEYTPSEYTPEVQWFRYRCSVCNQELSALCNNANCDGVRN